MRNVRDVRPVFCDLCGRDGGFKRGVWVIWRYKSVICDLESLYQWYMIGSKGFECFIWLRKNVKSMILSKNNGVLSKKVGILSFCW